MASDVSTSTEGSIVALLADVDGTLITKAKELTQRTIDAVHRIRERGGLFCVTSGRPPRGLSMYVDPLELNVAAAFNGGLIVRSDRKVIDQHPLPTDVAPRVLEALRAHALDAWVFGPRDWYVTDPLAWRVDRETSNIRFPPLVVSRLEDVLAGAIKIVGVSQDLEAVARCESILQRQFGTKVSAARCQPYYLDVTHPDANKGAVVDRLARYLEVPSTRIATIGDQANDVSMFKRSGLSIAMGNAT